MNIPFDRTKPSPIQAILDIRSSGLESVVVAGRDGAHPLHVDTGLEDRLLATVRADRSPVRLVVFSGSAGGGKSSAIDRLLRVERDLFEACIEDATHSETPQVGQVERLENFFAPFRDGGGAPPARPRLIAMNTGLMLRFFREVGRRAVPGTHHFSRLERVLRHKMALPAVAGGGDLDPDLDRAVLVVNLDHRPTTGGERSLMNRMLHAISPSDPSSPFSAGGRCGTCAVRAWCVPRTNAEIISAPAVAGVLDRLVDRLAREKGRPLVPRALRDLIAELVLGGTGFDSVADPCDTVLRWREAQDARAAFEHLACNGLFTDRGAAGLAGQLARSDPSFVPSAEAHDIVSSTGIDGDADMHRLIGWLGGDARPAVAVAARAIPAMVDSLDDRSALARCLVRAALLSGSISLPEEPDALFAEALEEYAGDTGGEGAIARLEELVASALARSFGYEVGMQRFFRVHTSRAGTVDVLVAADLAGAGQAALRVIPDPVRQANPQGAGIAGYRPMAISVELASVRLEIDTPLFRVLDGAASGARPSAGELERFYALRRAVEAIGRVASLDFDQPMLLASATTGVKHRLVRRRDYRGQPQVTVQEVH